MALGLGRFAYALLLPSMRTDLGWSFAQSGALNTANAGGYLVGALAAAAAGRRFGQRRAFTVGLAATAVALLLCGLTTSFALLMLLRGAVGITGAITFVVGAGLAAQLGVRSPRSSALILAVYFGGGGVGIALSGLGLPALLAATGESGWRLGWVALAAGATVAWLASGWAVRSCPEPAATTSGEHADWAIKPLWPIFASYFCFGAGYIAYMTFIVSYLRTGGASTTTVTAFWVVLGLAALITPFAWGPVLHRLQRGRGVAVVLAFLLVGAALPVLDRHDATFMLSAVVFGGSFLAVVTAVTTHAHRSVKRHAWTSVIAALTVCFALGQCAGPILSGVLSDGPGGLRAGLILSAAILAVGMVVALAQGDTRMS